MSGFRDWKVAPLTPTRVDTPDGSISVSWACNVDGGERERKAEEAARLVAAAPELLSSLEFAVKLLSGLPHVGGTAQLEHMRSVIARATGGAA